MHTNITAMIILTLIELFVVHNNIGLCDIYIYIPTGKLKELTITEFVVKTIIEKMKLQIYLLLIRRRYNDSTAQRNNVSDNHISLVPSPPPTHAQRS